jgi:RND family efflux transporter MFP subunit
MLRRLTAVAPLAAAALLTACSDNPVEQASEQSAPIVRVALAQSDSGPAAGNAYTGTVHARIESSLGFRVGGKIVERLVDNGVRVHAGQALFRIDASDLGLAAAAAAARVRAAEAEAARAAADEARLRGLVSAGAVSASAYDGAKAARDAASANLAAARASAANTANERGYATLFADADGVVTEVLAEPGQVVAAGTPVIRLARAGAREAVIAVPETAVSGLPRSGAAQVYGTGSRLPATLREVSGSADPVTRTFAARYVLAGSADQAPLGATVTLRVLTEAAGAVRVPLGAIVDQGRGPGLWIIGADARVRFRAAKLLRLTEEDAFVPADTLSPGTRIVALGGQLLHANEKVRPETQQAKPGL